MAITSFIMHVNDEPFQKIKNGTKTVELRLYDEKRRNLSITNNLLWLINRDNEQDALMARIRDVHIYPTFRELFENKELFDKCGFDCLSPLEAAEVMHKYYSAEDERKYGVIGIEMYGVISCKGFSNSRSSNRQDPHQDS